MFVVVVVVVVVVFAKTRTITMSIVYTATYLYRLSLTFYPLLAGIIYTVALSVYVQYEISLRQHVKGMISAAI